MELAEQAQRGDDVRVERRARVVDDAVRVLVDLEEQHGSFAVLPAESVAPRGKASQRRLRELRDGARTEALLEDLPVAEVLVLRCEIPESDELDVQLVAARRRHMDTASARWALDGDTLDRVTLRRDRGEVQLDAEARLHDRERSGAVVCVSYHRSVPDSAKLRRRRCECGAADCTAEVLISWDEQDAVDHAVDKNLWIVAPRHELRGTVSSVVFSTERYVVVTAREP